MSQGLLNPFGMSSLNLAVAFLVIGLLIYLGAKRFVIRPLKQLKAALNEAQETGRLKDELLARISHEIRTPLNGVVGISELLRDTQLSARQRRFADTIFESGNALIGIVNNILDFSKIEAGKLQLENVDVNLRALVEQTVESLADQAQRKGIELMSMVPPDLDIQVQTDPHRLRQVLTNLIGNAIKFTDEGEVLVRLKTCDTVGDKQRVKFQVRDTGIGIRRDKQQQIFESFTQEDESITRFYGGTGLGLSISQQLISQLGGKLVVKSRAGKGSVFSFKLDLCSANAAPEITPLKSHCIKGTRVLIVDDNATNLEILDYQLRSWGADTDCAPSASRAYDLLESAAATSQPYELAILDMHMPDADGIALARRIRANSTLKPLMLVILSSIATQVPDKLLQKLNIATQLSKPVRQAELKSALAALVGSDNALQQSVAEKPVGGRLLNGRVLLVEDNPVNSTVAECMLESLGVTVVHAQNGREAVDQCLVEQFDAVLMDCHMPVMNGLMATRAIRKAEVSNNKSALPIIAVTANALSEDRKQCMAAGMNEYLTKPFTSEQLHAVLALFLTKPDEIDMPDENSPIDSKTLQKLERLQRTGTPNIIRKVFLIYLQSSSVIKSRLVEALEQHDAGVARETAHALKSSSANVGADHLATLCQQIETMARKGEILNSQSFKEQIDSEYDRVVKALQIEIRLASA